MFSATWVALRSLFDSLPVLEVADVWLKANFSQALESKWKRHAFYGWLPGLISKAVFSVHLWRPAFASLTVETHLSKHTQDGNFNLYSITYFVCTISFCQTRLNLIRDFKCTVLPSINKVILIVACTCKCWALGRNKSHLGSVFLFSLKLAKKTKLCLLASVMCLLHLNYLSLTNAVMYKIRCDSPHPYKVMCVASG